MPARKRKTLGRYRIVGELGRGAMGVVYKAVDPVLDRTVALKTIVLDEDAGNREEYEARFFQEAKAAARLNHPALITIFDYGEEDNLAYMAMELLNGTELGKRMDSNMPPVHEAVSIAEQVAEGLAFAHDGGVVHRDIKPGNIMLLARGRVKIMDFGIARLKVSDVKTQTGTRLGTPKYMSPEQFTEGAVDHRTDIFSLGIVLYEMLTSAALFSGSDVAQVMHNITSFEPPPPSRVNREVPPLLDLVVKRALEKKPDARYQSGWEMADDLRNCLQELAPSVVVDIPRTGNDSVEDPAASSAVEKTTALRSLSDSGVRTRRLSLEHGPVYRLSVSRRFDSAAGLARMTTPATQDLYRLSREPGNPALLRRLWHDRDLSQFMVSLLLGALVAAIIVLS